MSTTTEERQTFVLVHGAWHGGWCWKKVADELEGAGHRVLTPTLPGHNDNTPVGEVNLDVYVNFLCDLLDSQTEPVVLVGHSLGGVLISMVAEHRPQKVKKLVYLTAFLLQSGETLLHWAQSDPQSLIVPNLIPNPLEGSVSIKEDVIEEGFYAECSPEDARVARSLLRKQALLPMATPVRLTQRYGSVRRFYIECMKDKAISLHTQREMQAKTPCEEVVSLDTDHSPFLSAPSLLARHLIRLGTS